MTAEPVTAAQPKHPMHAGTYPGQPDQVSRARRDVARHMAGHPATEDAVLIVSELARPDSPARVPILAHLSAIDAELAARGAGEVTS